MISIFSTLEDRVVISFDNDCEIIPFARREVTYNGDEQMFNIETVAEAIEYINDYCEDMIVLIG